MEDLICTAKVESLAEERRWSGELADTAESPEHATTEQHLPNQPVNSPLSELTQIAPNATQSVDSVPDSVNWSSYQTILQLQPEQTFAPVTEQVSQVCPEIHKAFTELDLSVRATLARSMLLLLNSVQSLTGSCSTFER